MALDYFARQKVDIAVIETGLGGRLDATNVLNPILTITTDISRDHVEILGRTRRQIAREKAGIIKPGVPHLVGLLPQDAMEVMRQTCRECGARLYRLKKSKLKTDMSHLRFSYHTDTLHLDNIAPSLVGTHQLKNAALAAEAINILRLHKSIAVSQQSVIKGIRNTGWPGRFHIVARNGHPTLVLDVAHNAAGMEAFVDSFEKKYPGRKTSVIVGFVKRKPHQQMFDSLSRIASDYAIVPLSTKRTIDVDETIKMLRWRGVAYRKYGTLATAYKRVLQSAGPDDIITVIGSHYLVGDFLGMIGWK